MSTPLTTSSDPGIPLREARPSDVEDIARIESESFSDPWPESAFRDFLARGHVRMTVAADETDKAVGYCVLLVMADEAEIANIAVATSARRRGIGACLLDDAIRAARDAHVVAIYLEVRASNSPARALYASRHFHFVGRRRAYYQHPTEDALVLRWTAED